jgi:hypothetical protein
MNALKGYKLSGRAQEPSYASMNPSFSDAAKESVLSKRIVNDYSRLPDAPGLAIVTDFRPETTRPLPMIPPAYNYNYGFPAGRPNVSSLSGAVPQDGTPLTKIGKGGYKILEPVNLYPTLKMRC